MKKLWFLWLCCFGLLISCRETKKPAVKDTWINYRKAYAFQNNKQTNLAFYYFNKVVSDADDSLQIAMSYTNMAIIQGDAGDFYGALESASKSLKYLNAGDINARIYLAVNYNELGLNSDNLKNYDDAIVYYDKAIIFTDDLNNKLVTLNNKAYAYQEKKAYATALNIYENIIGNPKPDSIVYARVLANLATTRSLMNPDYNPVPELLRSLNMRQHKNDLSGQNSSYGYLADYYARKQSDSAIFYARANYEIALRINNPDNRIHALKRLINVSTSQAVKQYFTNYQELNDSVQTARNAAKNQFALIRYNVEKSKSDNFKLQKDNTEKEFELVKQKVLLYSLIFLGTVGAVLSTLWYKKRKERMERETQNTISENQLKTSKKVHDVVANGLYRMMAEIENQDNINKNRLLDSIEEMYEKSRDISYEKVQYPSAFHEKISKLLTSFATDNIRVLLVGNSAELWEGIGADNRFEIEHILQELMVNMRKHSKADSVAVKFEHKNNQINISYTDNGVGLPTDVIYKNGLTNTGNRINILNGTITFDTSQEKGLKILISCPAT